MDSPFSVAYLRDMLDSREANESVNRGMIPWKTHPVVLRVRQHGGRREGALATENDYQLAAMQVVPAICA